VSVILKDNNNAHGAYIREIDLIVHELYKAILIIALDDVLLFNHV